MEQLPIVRCPLCTKPYLEDHFGIEFKEKLSITTKCSCGCEFDVSFQTEKDGFFKGLFGYTKIVPTIHIRRHR